MEGLREMALAYYMASNDDRKRFVDEFFDAMDPDRNGYVRFEEFSEYMKLMGHVQMSSKKFFNELKQEGTEELAHDDVLTLYYIINSGRLFCDGCGNFIKGNYFTCFKCFDNDLGHGESYYYSSNSTFNVCPPCFPDRKFDHHHNEFADPFSLLHSRKMEHFETWSPLDATAPSTPSASFFDLPYEADSGGRPSSSTNSFIDEIVRENRRRRNSTRGERLITLVQILENFGNLLAAATSTCTIM